MVSHTNFTFTVTQDSAGRRLDNVISENVPDCTRSYAATLIRKDLVRVDGEQQKTGYKVRVLQEICVHVPPPVPTTLLPEPVSFEILFEDAAVIVVNKPAGLVVHPAAGHYTGTLVHGLLHHCPNMEGIGGELRPGIVHRLDKDTSGVMVVAKKHSVHLALSMQFKQRRIKKSYQAVVAGSVREDQGCIDLPVGRHPVDRKKMSTVSSKSRAACTLWLVQERLPGATLLELDLKTGRTHQVRVHCHAIGHPIIGDPVYGGRVPKPPGKHALEIERILKSATRQLLHARKLSFTHPESGQLVTLEAPLPEDMVRVIDALRKLRLNDSDKYKIRISKCE